VNLAPQKLPRVAILSETAVAPRRRMLAGVARYMHENRPWSIYLKPYGVERSLDAWIRDWGGDGILLSTLEEGTSRLPKLGIPIVDMAGSLAPFGVPLVHADDVAIGRAGAEYLLDRNFRHFGFLEYGERTAAWSARRREGFAAAVAARGFPCEVYKVTFPAAGSGGPDVWERQQRGLVEWIRALPKPVGVMTSTDLLGQQFLESCGRASVVVPEEVAVVGADNDELICDVCAPPLTSVIIDDFLRGYRAAAVLDRLMAGEPPPREPIWIEPAGIVSRASTDILAIDDPVLAKALRYIRERATEGGDVEQLLRVVPVSRSVLERRFRKVLGRSVNDEFVRTRLNRAIELLQSTEMEPKAVAMKAGFGVPSYMGAVFKAKLGRTPGSYRASAAPLERRHHS
jgi:LacI family transcriptional regulator